MRARNLKPGLFKNELLGGADPLITILFEGLWCLADREGRLEDRPLRICAEVFPYRRNVTDKKVVTMLSWLHEQKFIERYEVAGQKFIRVIEFRKHQKPHKREIESVIPDPEKSDHDENQTHRSHQAGPRIDQGSDSTQPNNGQGTKEARSSPASSLNPHSLNPESPFSDYCDPGLEPDRRGNNRQLSTPVKPIALTLEQAKQLQATYPEGTYRQAEWLIVQKLVNEHLANGIAFERILASFERYAAQCRAREIVGTQYVLSPVKHCDLSAPLFDERFNLPKTKAEIHQDAISDAGDAWLARQEPHNATG